MIKTLYLVTLIDMKTGKMQQIWVDSPCPDGMQEFIETGLNPPLDLDDPRVINVEEKLVRISPLADPA